MSVKLREKLLKNGDISYYLDIYTPRGRKTKTLDIRARLKPKDQIEKTHKKEAFIKAKKLRSDYEMEMTNNEYGFEKKKDLKKNFFDVVNEYINSRKLSESSSANYKTLINSMKIHVRSEDFPIIKITESLLKGYIAYSSKSLSDSSINNRMALINAVMNFAIKKEYISENPTVFFTPIKIEKSKIRFLNEEEIKRLIHTKCSDYEVKRAFIFACYTGLRLGDIKKLKYSDIVTTEENNKCLQITMQKTKNEVIVPLHDEALKIINEPEFKDEFIFPLLEKKQSFGINVILRKWALESNIQKNLTFHDSRHTFGTRLANNKIGIEVAAKLLGHTDYKTTEIYYKISNQLKIEAINSLPSLGGF